MRGIFIFNGSDTAVLQLAAKAKMASSAPD
jgi:hypothetical protein